MIAYYSLLLRKKRESNGYNGDNHPKGVQHEDAEVVHLRGLKKKPQPKGAEFIVLLVWNPFQYLYPSGFQSKMPSCARAAPLIEHEQSFRQF